jgi:hypothetical protein
MKITDFLYETKNGRRRLKPQMIMLGIVSAFVIFVFLMVSSQRRSAQDRLGPGPFVTQQALPPRNLDYQIVKVDTIPFGHLTMPATADGSTPSQPGVRQSGLPKPGASGRMATQEKTAPSPATGATGVSGNSPMIVVSTLDQHGQSGTSLSALPGLQSVRVKVILPQKTPVMNGSLVEARVMKEERLGNIEIPRRAQLLGICSLQNNRVQIEFRELRIKEVTRTCTGRAYDLKQLPGIPYLPLDAKAKQAVLDELKSAASGVPILGRYLNQSELNPFTDEITTLEEGLEFYALISSIF